MPSERSAEIEADDLCYRAHLEGKSVKPNDLNNNRYYKTAGEAELALCALLCEQINTHIAKKPPSGDIADHHRLFEQNAADGLWTLRASAKTSLTLLEEALVGAMFGKRLAWGVVGFELPTASGGEPRPMCRLRPCERFCAWYRGLLTSQEWGKSLSRGVDSMSVDDMHCLREDVLRCMSEREPPETWEDVQHATMSGAAFDQPWARNQSHSFVIWAARNVYSYAANERDCYYDKVVFVPRNPPEEAHSYKATAAASSSSSM